MAQTQHRDNTMSLACTLCSARFTTQSQFDRHCSRQTACVSQQVVLNYIRDRLDGSRFQQQENELQARQEQIQQLTDRVALLDDEQQRLRNQLRAERESINDRIQLASNRAHDMLNAQLDAQQQKVHDLETQVVTLSGKLQSAHAEMQAMRDILQRGSTSQELAEELESRSEEVERLEGELRNIHHDQHHIVIRVRELETQQRVSRTRIQDLQHQLEAANARVEELESYFSDNASYSSDSSTTTPITNAFHPEALGMQRDGRGGWMARHGVQSTVQAEDNTERSDDGHDQVQELRDEIERLKQEHEEDRRLLCERILELERTAYRVWREIHISGCKEWLSDKAKISIKKRIQSLFTQKDVENMFEALYPHLIVQHIVVSNDILRIVLAANPPTECQICFENIASKTQLCTTCKTSQMCANCERSQKRMYGHCPFCRTPY